MKRILYLLMCFAVMFNVMGVDSYGGIVGGGSYAVVASDGFVGNDGARSSAKAVYLDRGIYTDFVATTTGDVSYAHFYSENGSGEQVNVAIYDSAGTTKLGESNLTASTAGWNNLALDSSFSVTSGTTYRLAVGCKDYTDFSVGISAAASNSYVSYGFNVEDSMPSSITGTDETSTSNNIMMYLDNSAT